MNHGHQAEYIALCVLLRRLRHQPRVLLCRQPGGQHWSFPTKIFMPGQGENPRMVFDRQMLEIFSLDTHRLQVSTLIPSFQSEGRLVRIVMHLADKEYAPIGDDAPVRVKWISIVDMKAGKARMDGVSARTLLWLAKEAEGLYWFQ